MKGHGMPQGDNPNARSKDFRGTVKRLLRELRPDRARIIISIIATVVSVGASVAAPAMLGRATDLVFSGVVGNILAGKPSKTEAIADLKAQGNDQLASMLEAIDAVPGAGIDFALLGRMLLIVAGIYVLSSLASWVTGLLLRTAVQNTGWRIRQKIQNKIEVLPLSYVDRTPRGDLISRVTNDVDNVTQTLNNLLSQFIQSLLTVIGIIAMMLTMSWKLTLLSLIVLPIGLAIVGILMAKAQPYFTAQWRHTGTVSATVEDAISGHEVALLYGLEDQFAQTFRQENTALKEASTRAQFVSTLVMPIMNIISSVTYVVVAIGGGLMVAGGSMTLGAVQAFIQYSRQFMHPLGTLSSMAAMIQSGAASAERVWEFLDEEELSADNTATKLPADLKGHIVFDHVTFSYEPGKPIIKDLSLEVQPGQMVAIIGPTGAGKTTLVNLLMRFYEIDSGTITIDGVNIADISREELRSRMAMVLQDTWLFDGTIEDNIAFGRQDATADDVRDAARISGAHALIRHLPDGYATHISDESDALSQGERQLLTIARAFVTEPDLLILDEATSSVDTRTELVIAQAMDRLRHGRTAFVIAHRLSTIRDADIIVVMKDGDVVETGDHATLLAANGTYAELYRAGAA